MAISTNIENSVGIHTSVLHLIYHSVCIESSSDEDINTLKDYESDGTREKDILIDAVVKACKIFKAKCLLLSQQPPTADKIKIEWRYPTYPKEFEVVVLTK